MNTWSWLLVVASLWGCGRVEGPAGPRGLPGLPGREGEKGEPGAGYITPPQIAGVTPRAVVAGQTLEVSITGSGTEWSNSTLVNFGDGITVLSVVNPSPVALVVTIQVDKAAAPGMRDISVNHNGQQAHWRSAFRVNELSRVEVFGKPGRGALALVRLSVFDPDFTFDTSWNGSSWLGVKAFSSPSSTIVVQEVRPRSVDLLITGDIDAPLGKRDLRVVSQPGRPGERSFSFPQLFEFADLTEQTVVPGTPATGTFSGSYGSAEYKFVPATTGVELLASVTISGGVTSGIGNPMLATMSSLGKFPTTSVPMTNSYTFTPFTTASPYYFVIFDPTGSGAYSYSFNVAPLTRISELEPNDSKETAMALTPPSLQTASMSSSLDVDWFKVVATDAEVGRHLRVRTRYGTTGHSSTDSKIEVFRPDGTLFAGPVDLVYHEDLRTDALTSSGEWVIKVSWGAYSTSAWTISRSAYELLVNWE